MLGGSTMGEGMGRGFLGVLRRLLVDLPFTLSRRSKFRAARDAENVWWTSMTDDPTTLDRLAAIMADSPSVCPRCGQDAYVCRAIGCEADMAPASTNPTLALVLASSAD